VFAAFFGQNAMVGKCCANDFDNFLLGGPINLGGVVITAFFDR